jgi:hypothetical protein
MTTPSLRPLLLAALAVGMVGALPSTADAACLDGQWGGANAQGFTAQVGMTDGKLTDVYWADDYRTPEDIHYSNGGARMDFTLDGKKATIILTPTKGQMTGPGFDGRPLTIDIKKD